MYLPFNSWESSNHLIYIYIYIYIPQLKHQESQKIEHGVVMKKKEGVKRKPIH